MYLFQKFEKKDLEKMAFFSNMARKYYCLRLLNLSVQFFRAPKSFYNRGRSACADFSLFAARSQVLLLTFVASYMLAASRGREIAVSCKLLSYCFSSLLAVPSLLFAVRQSLLASRCLTPVSRLKVLVFFGLCCSLFTTCSILLDIPYSIPMTHLSILAIYLFAH